MSRTHHLAALVVAALLSLVGGFTATSARTASADGADAPAGSFSAAADRITAGEKHTCALTADPGASSGTVRCWGNNALGQLGLGDTANRGDQPGEMGDSLPAVDLGRPAVSIAAGLAHTCAILDDGSVKCWGANTSGQLGLGDTLTRGDGPGEMGANLPTVDLGTGRTALQISAGAEFTCALTDDGMVRCWGNNAVGQLGVGDTANRGDDGAEMGDLLQTVDLGFGRTALSITTGGSHACALLDTHVLKCWGYNASGQLGLGDTANRGDGPGEMGDNLPAVDLGTGFTAWSVTAGRFHTCAQISALQVKCWGQSDHYQLGHFSVDNIGDGAGEMGDALVPVTQLDEDVIRSITATSFGTCVLFVVAGSKCWGQNNKGQVGIGSTDDVSYAFFSLPGGLAIAGGHEHVCWISATNDVKCMGANDSGQLGDGTTENYGDAPGENLSALPSPVLRSRVKAVATAVGSSQSCFLLLGGTVKCFGYAGGGALGLGDLVDRGHDASTAGDNLPAVDLGTGRTAVKLVGANGAFCAILDNGSLKCWGWNPYGQLGYGDTADRGDAAGEMGDNLPAVDLGTGRTAVDVDMGQYHSCAILDNAKVKCWGYGTGGQLGYGDTTSRGDQPGEMGDNLPYVDLGTGRTAKKITVGSQFACAILDNDKVKCWGYNSSGTLGLGDVTSRGGAPGTMGDDLPYVDLGTGRTALAIDSDYSTCVVLDDHSVKCWGVNEYGEAGQGHVNRIGDGAGEMGNNLPPVSLGTGRTAVKVRVGSRNACALLDNGSLKCWGSNLAGQLGIDSTTDHGGLPGTMGDSLPAAILPAAVATFDVTVNHVCAVLVDGRAKCWGQGSFGELATGANDYFIGQIAGSMAAGGLAEVGGALNKVIPFTTTPGIIRDLAATPGVGSASLAWTAPDDGGSPITGYRIERSADGGATWTVHTANTGSATAAATVTGLTNGTSYRFRVATLNAKGSGPVSAPTTAVQAGVAGYLPLTPARLADTRPGKTTVDGIGAGTGLVAAGSTLQVQVGGRGGVPSDALAAVLNVTVTQPAAGGYLTVYPCGVTKPNASTLNFTGGRTVANAVVAKLGTAGKVCIYAGATTHVIVDVNGSYPAGNPYLPLTPARLADTRPGKTTVDGIGAGTGLVAAGTTLQVKVAGRGGVPSDALAAVLNVTVTQPSAGGYVTVFPCDVAKPNASTLNFGGGQTVANAVIAKLAADGTVCIYSVAATHLIVDVGGAHPTASPYNPLTPARMADTRIGKTTIDGIGAGTGLVTAGSVLEVQITGRGVVKAGVAAVVMNVTVTQPAAGGYITVFPCGVTRPNASTLNFTTGQTVANAVIAKVGTGGKVCIYAGATTHLIVDISGSH